jgi:NB-ARC domain/Tetratricopeptide repeat
MSVPPQGDAGTGEEARVVHVDHGQGVQVGDHNRQTNSSTQITAGRDALVAGRDMNVQDLHVHLEGRRETPWPHRVGAVPAPAQYWQHRSEADLLTAGLLDTSAVGSQAIVLTPVLSGLGGVGKTQLAAACAEKIYTNGQVDLLVWVTAASRKAIEEEYAQAASEVTGSEDADTVRGAARFLTWLADTGRRWLIVLDDLTTPADLAGLWPPAVPTGRTIVTTRRRDAALTGPYRKLLPVGLFSPAEAAGYLAARLADRPQLLDGAQALAADLGYLPLALAQAAAYLEDRRLTCAQYRARLADRRLRLDSLLPEPDALPDAHQATVAATWSLSVELANTLKPQGLARPLLHIAAALDPNGIPARVFSTAACLDYVAGSRGERPATPGDRETPAFPAAAPGSEELEIAADQAQDGLHGLTRLSLITVDEENDARTVRIHALVQRATREALTALDSAATARAAADALLEAWPPVEQDPGLGQALRSNTEALNINFPRVLWSPRIHPVLLRAGRSLGEAGSVTAAVIYFRQMTDTALQLLGPDHPDTLTTRHELALWQGQAGNAGEAAASYRSLLADRLRVLGPEHPDTLATRGNLAWWTGRAGDAAAAAAAFEQLLADQVPTFGHDHPAVLITRHNLAYWYAHAGLIAESTARFERLLADQLANLGPDHPLTMTTRSELIRWRGGCGHSAGAALQELLKDRSRILGPQHPDTLQTRYDLSQWHASSGDHTRAHAELAQLLAEQTRIMGPQHPRTNATRQALDANFL